MLMKYVYYLLISFILIANISSAQKDGNIWYFGQKAGLDFNSGTPVALNNGKIATNEGCSSIADRNTGQLLFYTDGITIWDKTHAVMLGGTGLYGAPSSTQSGIIIPQPGSSTIYYVFTTDAQAGNAPQSISGYGGVAYSIVDISLNGGKGAVTALNVPLLVPATEKIAGVRHCNGTDFWVVVHKWNSNSFYAYQLSSSGLSAPVISNTGIVHQDMGSGTNAEAIGYMKFSPDAKKLALACYINRNTVQIFDFDNSTGVLSNPITDTNYPGALQKDGPYGVSFSPDNSRLYVSMFSLNSTSYVYQYNMLAGSGSAIIASRTAVASSVAYIFGALQNGPDGKIYLSKQLSSTLGVINNPNGLGAACNYVSTGPSLTPGYCQYGLPVIVESYLVTGSQAIGTLTYPGCSGNNTLTFSDSTLIGTINYQWNFGDPASGSANTSTLQNPSHTFTSSGTYTVSVTIGNSCSSKTYSSSVTVGGSAISVSAGTDVTICSNDSSRLIVTGAPGGSTYSWAPANGLSCTNCSNPYAKPTSTTTYYITVNSGGCIGKDTVTVNVTPGITAKVSPSDTTICENDFVQLNASGGTNYQWSPGAGLSNPSIADPYCFTTTTTTYTVTITSGSCPAATATSKINIVKSPPVPLITQSHDTLFCSSNPNYTSYQWYFNASMIPGATLPYLVINQSGNYNVQVQNSNNCSIAVGINVILTGFENYFSPNAAEILFNSSTKELTIKGINQNERYEVSIYDILGRYVYSSEFELGRSAANTINLSQLTKGVFLVRVTGKSGIKVNRFVND